MSATIPLSGQVDWQAKYMALLANFYVATEVIDTARGIASQYPPLANDIAVFDAAMDNTSRSSTAEDDTLPCGCDKGSTSYACHKADPSVGMGCMCECHAETDIANYDGLSEANTAVTQ